jgi:hypothetical protein
MDAILREDTTFDEMKADEYRHRQSRPVHERMDAIKKMIQIVFAPGAPGLGLERWESTNLDPRGL